MQSTEGVYNKTMPRARKTKTATRETKHVLGYIRVSTDRQVDSGASIASQKAAIIAECERNGWHLAEMIEDGGLSGKNLKRPGLQKALEMLNKGEADVLMAAKLDRLSRSVKDFAQMVDMSNYYGWSVSVLDCKVDTSTPAGEMLVGVMVQVAQFERRIISQRTKDALAVKKAQGVTWGGSKPIMDTDTEDLILNLRASGMGMIAIAKELNARNVPTAKGGSWHGSTVRVVLQRREAA